MIPLVVDASVAIKWLVREPGADVALKLRKCRLSAPDLLIAECANILWKKVRRGEYSEAEALQAGDLLQQINIELVPMRPMLGSATRLSVKLDHPAYDCFYLALAEATGCAFVTADERLLRKAQAYLGAARIFSLATVIGELGLSASP